MFKSIRRWFGQVFNKVKPVTDNRSTMDVVKLPLWYELALSQVGVSETNNTIKILEYHKATSLKAKSVKVSWCASFVSWVLLNSGYKSLNTAWARDYQSYGINLPDPKPYCVMGFERNDPGGDSHVGFWTGKETTTHYEILSGNQDDMVKLKYYAKADFLYAKWPVTK